MSISSPGNMWLVLLGYMVLVARNNSWLDQRPDSTQVILLCQYTGRDLNSAFSFSKISLSTYKARKSSLLYYLFIAGRKKDWSIFFPKVLVQSEIQTAVCRIWTLLNKSTFYYYNPHTIYASLKFDSKTKLWSDVELVNVSTMVEE